MGGEGDEKRVEDGVGQGGRGWEEEEEEEEKFEIMGAQEWKLMKRGLASSRLFARVAGYIYSLMRKLLAPWDGRGDERCTTPYSSRAQDERCWTMRRFARPAEKMR